MVSGERAEGKFICELSTCPPMRWLVVREQRASFYDLSNIFFYTMQMNND